MTTDHNRSNQEFPYLANTNADIRLLGFPNVLSSFCQFNSAPRIGMFNHHLSQTMIIDKPEFNKLFTGVEHKFIDYTFNSSRREYDCEILAVIPKYRNPIVDAKLCPQFYVIVLTYEPNNKRRLDYFTIDRYFMGSNDFGWLPEIENLSQIRPGEYLDKDTPITHSPAVDGAQYKLGRNLNIAYGSFPETVEDAFVISESAAAALQTQQVSQKQITFRMDRRPLNANGNEHDDKFLPDIGSIVRDDGILCASRPLHWSTCLADTDPEALREPLPLQDDITYIEAGARILDLTFNINRTKLNSCYEQARRYDQNNLRCWEDIYKTYVRHKNEYKLTPKMSTLVRTAIYRMIAGDSHDQMIRDQFRKALRSFDIEGPSGQTIEFMQAIVTYTIPRAVSRGSKLTDQSGAKGVVGVVYPDDWMPVDEYGIRADMMIDMNSPVGRNNPGQLYETGINRISEFVRRQCQEVYTIKGTDAAHELLLDYYNDVNPNYAKLILEDDISTKDKKETVENAIEIGPRIWIPPFLTSLTPSKDDFWNALRNIQTWAKKWNVKPSRITYKSLQADGTGKEFTTKALFSIGSKYTYQLHKVPEITAPGPAAVNHIGIPTKANFEAKNYPVSTNPYRYGEDELRIISMDTDIREVTRFQNLLANSPTGVEVTIRSLLLSEHPTRIKRMPISNGRLAETSAVLSLFHNTSAALGFETKSTRNDVLTAKLFELLATNEDLANSIAKVDIVSARENGVHGEQTSSVKKRASQKRAKVKKMLEDVALEDEVLPDDDDEEVIEEVADATEDAE